MNEVKFNDSLVEINKRNYAKALDGLIELTKTHREIPNYVWHNVGLCYQQLGQFEIAIDFYLKANSVKKDGQTYWNLAHCHLTKGRLLEGFRYHEYRLKVCGKKPGWQGEDINGKTLVVLRDGGLGDAIQFFRYIPLLKAYNCKVFVDMPPELVCLFGDFVSGITPAIVASEEILHVYLMSLPHCFKTELHTIPPPVKIRCRLSPQKGRVGVVWQCSADSIYTTKSIDLREFIPLISMTNINYVCLQKEVSEKDQMTLDNYHVERQTIRDFSDTVKLIQQCEYVISACTSVAHLAATMGVPTLIPLAFNHCWRWLEDRIDSPWYPSIRLYRQKNSGDWSEPLKEVQQFLTKKF